MEWNVPVSINEIENVENILKGNIYVFDIATLPVLNTTSNIYSSLMYKSEYNEDHKQCYLLFDNDQYHCITEAKGFLATKYYCPKCCSCFHHRSAIDKHCCSESKDINKLRHNDDNDNRMAKDVAHYLSRGICKGSDDEIQHKLLNWHGKKYKEGDTDSINAFIEAKAIYEKAITKQIKNPRYINYDFETDTSSGIHRPNLCIAQVLEIDDNHDYKKSLKKQKYLRVITVVKISVIGY